MSGIEAIEHETAKVRMLRDEAAKHEKWDRAYGWSCVLEGIDHAARILLGGGGAEQAGVSGAPKQSGASSHTKALSKLCKVSPDQSSLL